MKYRDIVNFEPIETVVQINEADQKTQAEKLVKNYVISDRMADKLVDVIIPNLQFKEPMDNKGLLIVGNYGTGKSHLMSVLSTIAEYDYSVELLKNEKVKAEVQNIAGNFKVYRMEIGATEMDLRGIIFSRLEKFLRELGIDYSFPSSSTITNNKDSLMEMMDLFERKFPGKGLLLVVDELLDYLRTRKETDLIRDLNFLREIGEVSKNSRFRFLAGIQETLFENPRFQFVADLVRRVRDRFDQLQISREDISYVVANRLLKKNKKQMDLVRSHLEKFSPLYKNLAEKVDQFVNLYPVHPTYLDVFERVFVVEQREVLKTLSLTIKEMLDQDIPQEEPGIISFDSYWRYIKENPALRSVDEVKTVLDKSQDLEGILETSFKTEVYKPTAIRIIHALSVYRLTTGNLYAQIGLTAESIRDDLMIHIPNLPEKDEEFLKTTIESIMEEIKRTVSGQFISYNRENEQYYLDIKKDIDYDAKIEEKAEGLKHELNSYYYNVLNWALENGEDARYGNYNIWEYEINWEERNATRLGWLFFGAPNERTTAQPPRDFYLYFLKPFFDENNFTDEEKPDEVFFRLARPDEEFKTILSLYSGAQEMLKISSGESKKIYSQKAEDYRKKVKEWLDKNLSTAFDVTHQGVTKKFVEVLKPTKRQHENTKEMVNAVASNCLSTYFEELTPEYPVFSLPTTSRNRQEYAQEAIRWIATETKTETGRRVLDSLELLEEEKLKPEESKYARFIKDIISNKGKNQVVSRGEIIKEFEGVEYSTKFRLEPEWVIVLIAALVYDGEINLNLHGKVFDASNIEELTKEKISDLINFKHLSPPKDLPLAELQELFEFFGLPRGLIKNKASQDEGVRKLQSKIDEELNNLVRLQPELNKEISGFKVSLIQEAEKEQHKKKLDEFKNFLESLQVFNSVGKLKNFRYERKDITKHEVAKKIIEEVEGILELKKEIDPLDGYLSQGEMAFPEGHPWIEEVKEKRKEIVALIQGELDDENRRNLLSILKGLKRAYIDYYIDWHKKARLDAKGDEKKKEIMKSRKLELLNNLKQISIMPSAHLEGFKNQLGDLKSCYNLTKSEMEDRPVCKHCNFKPTQDSEVKKDTEEKPVSGLIEKMDEELDEILQNWTNKLLENLEDPMVRPNIDLLTSDQAKGRVKTFIKERDLPSHLDSEFINSINEVLSGLVEKTLKIDEVRQALLLGGNPCTIDELKERFEQYIEKETQNEDPSKIRIILE